MKPCRASGRERFCFPQPRRPRSTCLHVSRVILTHSLIHVHDDATSAAVTTHQRVVHRTDDNPRLRIQRRHILCVSVHYQIIRYLSCDTGGEEKEGGLKGACRVSALSWGCRSYLPIIYRRTGYASLPSSRRCLRR